MVPAGRSGNARAVVAWSAACLVVVLSTTNPVYRGAVLLAALVVVLAGAGLARARRLLVVAGVAAAMAASVNILLSHAGADALFELPDSVPVVGGSYTLEAVVYGLVAGATLAAAVLAVAPVSLLLEPHELVDALPRALSRTGGAVAAAMSMVPNLAGTFTAVSEAQRLRGWRPRGPASWAEIVVPVVLTAIEDSVQLAESMEARAYGSGPRTRLRRARLRPGDWLVVGAAGASVAAFWSADLAGWVVDWYAYPDLSLPDLSPLPLAACLSLALPALLWRSRPWPA